MEESKGFWLALGAGVSAVLGFLLYILTGLIGARPPKDPSKDLDENRAREEARIRAEIQRETDQQLADHFNKVAGDKGKKE
jgi:hypothetical protein